MISTIIPKGFKTIKIKIGYANDDAIKKHGATLESVLQTNDIEFYGNFRFLGYNAPHQFWGRKNEIIVSVRCNEK